MHTSRISGLLLITTKPFSNVWFCYEGQNSSALGSRTVIKRKVHFLREVESQVGVDGDQYL